MTDQCAECGTHTDDCGPLTRGLCWSCLAHDEEQTTKLSRMLDHYAARSAAADEIKAHRRTFCKQTIHDRAIMVEALRRAANARRSAQAAARAYDASGDAPLISQRITLANQARHEFRSRKYSHRVNIEGARVTRQGTYL